MSAAYTNFIGPAQAGFSPATYEVVCQRLKRVVCYSENWRHARRRLGPNFGDSHDAKWPTTTACLPR